MSDVNLGVIHVFSHGSEGILVRESNLVVARVQFPQTRYVAASGENEVVYHDLIVKTTTPGAMAALLKSDIDDRLLLVGSADTYDAPGSQRPSFAMRVFKVISEDGGFVNEWAFTARAGSEPEVGYTERGGMTTKLRGAIQLGKESTAWINTRAYSPDGNGVPKVLADWVRKGYRFGGTGRLNISTYTNEGAVREWIEFNLNTLALLQPKGENDNGESEVTQPSKFPKSTARKSSKPKTVKGEDDMPDF